MPTPNTAAPYEHHAQREMIRLAQRAGRIEAQRDHLIEALERMERWFKRDCPEVARARGMLALQEIKDQIADEALRSEA